MPGLRGSPRRLGPGLMLGLLMAWRGAAADPIYEGLDEQGRDAAQSAVQSALERYGSDVTYRWRSAQTPLSGRITPLRTFKIASGHYCRDFEEILITTSGVRLETQTACRDDGGRWLKVSD